MRLLVDAWLKDMGFDENGVWHTAPILDHWRWAFSDLPGEAVKSTVAALIMRILLGADPATLSPEELEFLDMSGFHTPGARLSSQLGALCDA